MEYSKIINNIHSLIIIYLIFGCTIQSQRGFLVFFLPTVQLQFLVNDNQCILTQLEKKLIQNESPIKDKEIVYDSFVDTKLKQFNINVTDRTRELIINYAVYSSFIFSYCFM